MPVAIRSRRAAVAALIVPLATVPAAHAAWPSRMAAMGDSITQASASCGWLVFCQANSWSTGTSGAVKSHLVRIPRKGVSAANFSVNGEWSRDLVRQANQAVGFRAEYVTILMGANDACAATPEEMTPVADYATGFQQAIDVLRSGLANSKVLVVSIPNLYRLWQVLHTDWRALAAWSTTEVCRSMLAYPTSTAPEDEARRQQVLQRVRDFNDAARAACATWSRCRFDGNRFFNYPFQPQHVSSTDYFHPSVAGQAVLSSEEWAVVTAGDWLKGP